MNPQPVAIGDYREALPRQRPATCWSDLWTAPLHDLPLRDEIVYQFLPLAPAMRLAEIGPGSGVTAFRLARQVAQVTLLDIAPGNVARLESALGALANVNCVCGDMCAPGLADAAGHARFDAIFALEVFEYAADSATAFQNFAAMLRPGGTLLLQWPNYPPERTRGVTWFPDRAKLDREMGEAGFAGWSFYQLKLRPWAGWMFRNCHERPLRLYRRLRGGPGQRPAHFDETWSFRRENKLAAYKLALHAAWAVLMPLMRAFGPCFERTPLGDDIAGRNLLLVARR